MILLVCEILKKMIQMNLFTKENRLTDTENKRMVAKRERVGGEINKEFGNKIYALLYIK